MQKGDVQTYRTFSSESIHVCLCLCDNISWKVRNAIFHVRHLSKTVNVVVKASLAYTNQQTLCYLINIMVGFFLICRAQNDCTKILLYSIDCKEHSIGVCVKSNTGASSLPPIVTTFGLYWKYCRNNNRYIVGDTSQTYDSKYKIYQKYYIHIPTDTYS